MTLMFPDVFCPLPSLCALDLASRLCLQRGRELTPTGLWRDGAALSKA